MSSTEEISLEKLPSSNTRKPIVREKGVSATAILTNFICGMLGPGCFSVALSFKQSGLWVGKTLYTFICFLSRSQSCTSIAQR
ncbi:hypothetical protein OESDEN_17625 [Oesophagostomum dentatum]|uniref:Amino acid transporter transmembrane domain-containing protein n=1 Tax=Oesophagostomum dentatum TaxID=61180 RepID=A0A0B1SHN4_OESDE|nr:hypothetical protein OESDEN_17625 [Oesophagostomum dentatum]